MRIYSDGTPAWIIQNELGLYSSEIIKGIHRYTQTSIHLLIKESAAYKMQTSNYLEYDYQLIETHHIHKKESSIAEILKRDEGYYHCMNNGFSIDERYVEKSICSIHTMMPFTHPSLCQDLYRDKFYQRMEMIREHAIPIITTTEALKVEINALTACDLDQIHVISPSLSRRYHPLSSDLKALYVPHKFHIYSPYLLYVGDVHKGKQIEGMIYLLVKLKQQEPCIKLLILTKELSHHRAYIKGIKGLCYKLGVEENIIWMNTYTQQDKLYLYNQALYFLDFAIDNSINLNLLEACQCHCPILCSATDAHKELLGGKALYIDFKVLSKWIEDSHLLLEPYVHKGIQLKLTQEDTWFDQERAAQQLERVYNKILEGKGVCYGAL